MDSTPLDALEEQIAGQSQMKVEEETIGGVDDSSSATKTMPIVEDSLPGAILPQDGNDEDYRMGDALLDSLISEKVRFDPDVEEFLLSLYFEVYDRNVDTIRRLYEHDFHAVTQSLYTEQRWPSPEDVEAFYRYYQRYHTLIIILYRELYFRHLFVRFGDKITWKDRKDAWETYHLFIQYLIEEECSRKVESEVKGLRLPSSWVWDMFDEFVYQFQDSCRWRSKLCQQYLRSSSQETDPKNDVIMSEELVQEVLKESDVWKSSQVLEYLHVLVERSEIRELLRDKKDDVSRIMSGDADLKYQVGYFAMISLLRLHVLLGDYNLALEMISDLELSTRSLYWKIPACHLSLFYHMGFAYMMLRRYNDAIRVVSQILIFVTKQRGYLTGHTYAQQSMNRMVDKMYLTLMMCSSLTHVRPDESIQQTIKDRFSDKHYKLQQENEETYQELFNKAAPKFFNPAMPSDVIAAFNHSKPFQHLSNSDGDGGISMYVINLQSEAQSRQLNLFLKEVNFQKKVANINSFAKLYNNIQLSKLASLMEVKDKVGEEAVRSEILCVKQKGRQKVWKQGKLLSGDWVVCQSDSSVEFFMEHDMVHVKNQKTNKVFIDLFMKQLERSQQLLTTITGPTRSAMRDVNRERIANEGLNHERRIEDGAVSSNRRERQYNSNHERAFDENERTDAFDRRKE